MLIAPAQFFDGITRYWDRDGPDAPLRNRAPEMIAVADLVQYLRQQGIYSAEMIPKLASVPTSMYVRYDDQPYVLAEQIYDLTIRLFGVYATHRKDLVDATPKSRLFWETFAMLQLLDTLCESDTEVPELCARIKQDHKILEEFIYD